MPLRCLVTSYLCCGNSNLITFPTIYYEVKVGDLVKLNVHSHFTNGIKDVIGIPFHAIGVILQSKCDVYSVMFPTVGDRVISFMKQDLEIVSEGE